MQRIIFLSSLVLLSLYSVAQERLVRPLKSHYPAGAARAKSGAAGDIDGDGDIDIITSRMELMLNDGRGVLTRAPVQPFPVYWADVPLALVDLDADGDLDLISTDANRQYPVQLNDGLGHFAPVLGTPRLYARAIAVGDVDGDQDCDVILTTGFRVPELWLNDGRGQLTLAANPLTSHHHGLAVVSDIDADGDLDLLFTGTIRPGAPAITLLLNSGSGQFTDVTQSRIAAFTGPGLDLDVIDLDGDGDLDISVLLAGKTQFLINGGQASFSLGRTISGHAEMQAVADLDANGLTDIIQRKFNPQRMAYDVAILSQQTAGAFVAAKAGDLPEPWRPPTALVPADFDGDGFSDLFLGDTVWLNDGLGRFADGLANQAVALRQVVSHVLLVDVDGDGDLDSLCWEHKIQLLLNDSNGEFADVTSSSIPKLPTSVASVAIFDVDADQDPDLVLAMAGDRNRLLINDGKGVFTDVSLTNMPNHLAKSRRVVVGDVDGDGIPDLIFAEANSLSLYRGSPGAVYRTVQSFESLSPVASMWLKDFDGDGDLDILVPAALLLNDGKGKFTRALVAQYPYSIRCASSLDVADVDRDGDLDLAGTSRYCGTRLLLNDGRGFFKDVTATHVPKLPRLPGILHLSDFDEDGAPEMVLTQQEQTTSSHEMLLLSNDGSGHFTWIPGGMPLSPLSPQGFASGDLDGDGDLDLMAARGYLFPILSRHRELTTPLLARRGRTFEVVVSSRPGYATMPKMAFGAMSVGTTQLPIAPFGVWHLNLATQVSLPPLFILPPAGEAKLSLVIPVDPALAEREFSCQFLLADPEGRWRFTRVVTDRIR